MQTASPWSLLSLELKGRNRAHIVILAIILPRSEANSKLQKIKTQKERQLGRKTRKICLVAGKIKENRISYTRLMLLLLKIWRNLRNWSERSLSNQIRKVKIWSKLKWRRFIFSAAKQLKERTNLNRSWIASFKICLATEKWQINCKSKELSYIFQATKQSTEIERRRKYFGF